MNVLFYDKCRIKTHVADYIQVYEVEEKDVNFYDYDGFRLLSYTNAEALALTELPDNPIANENLTFDGWNWTLSAIKSQINNVGGVVNVGAIYHTTDGKTHITCRPTETYTQAYICLMPTVANAVTVDWGDGSTDTWASAAQAATKSHTYTGVTDPSVYDITISCSSGTYLFSTYITGTIANNQKCVYTDVKLSDKVISIGQYCFYQCCYLKTISVPNSVAGFLKQCFYRCYSLQSINVPSVVTNFNNGSFNYCISLKNASVPSTLTGFGYNCFGMCYSLVHMTIPDGVTGISGSCFHQCYGLIDVFLPNSVTSIGEDCFYSDALMSMSFSSGITTLGDNCFRSVGSLLSVTIPSSVTSIGSYCFHACYSLRKIYMESSTPPTLASNNSLPSNANLVIYVPTGSLSTYQTETNWSTFASKMIEYN